MAKVGGITALGQGHHHEGHEDGVTSLLGPREQSSKSQRIILRPQNLMKFALLDLTCLGYVTPFFLQISPFWNGSVHLCLSHCIPEADNFFSSFTSLWMESNFGPEQIIPNVSPIPDLNKIKDEVSDFLRLLHLDDILGLKLMLEWLIL